MTHEQSNELLDLKEDVILGRDMSNRSWDRLYYLSNLKAGEDNA